MAVEKVQCQICGQHFNRITKSHLSLCAPGMSLDEYQELYAPLTAKGVKAAEVVQYADVVAEKVVGAITGDEVLLTELASRVGQFLFTDHLRGKVLGTALMLLAERSETYRKMADRVKVVDEEIFQEHRLTAGGPGGAPTETETLLQIARHASTRMKDAEDTLLRILRTAVDERKAHGVQLNLQQNFSGKHEQVVVPASFDSKQREALRLLSSRLSQKSITVREIIAKVKPEDESKSEEDTENGAALE